jgi:hypothetical protein
MNDILGELDAALATRGIANPDEFRRRYGVDPAAIGPADALALVETPAWVTGIWLPNAGGSPVAYIPRAVRRYAAVFGLAQAEGESDHDFNERLRARLPRARPLP